MLAAVSSDGERLLHQTIRLISVAVRPTLLLWLGACHAIAILRLVEAVAAALALHLAVRQKATRHATGAPRFAVGPSSHARLALIPHENRSRFDRLSLLLRESSLDAREQANATCFEENDGVGRRPDVTVICLHPVHRLVVLSCARERGPVGLGRDEGEVGFFRTAPLQVLISHSLTGRREHATVRVQPNRRVVSSSQRVVRLAAGVLCVDS